MTTFAKKNSITAMGGVSKTPDKAVVSNFDAVSLENGQVELVR